MAQLLQKLLNHFSSVSKVNIVDLIILVILGFAAYKGYQKGLFISLLSVVAFILSIVLAFVLLDWGVDLLGNYIEGFKGLLPYLAFIVLFGVVALLINLAGTLAKKALDLTLLGSLDNLAGAALGVIKWIFGVSLLIWLTHTVGIELPGEMHESSWLYSRVEPVAPWVIDSFSEYWPFIKSLFESIKERLQPPIT